jgi:hypothetical protein
MNSTLKIESQIEKAVELDADDKLLIHFGFYFLGILLILIVYFGPMFYYKIYKKKNFTPQSSIRIRHAI